MSSAIDYAGALRREVRSNATPQHESYFLDVPPAPSAKDISIFRFTSVEAIGEARRFDIFFTHPLPDLPRADYLNRAATFTLQPVALPGTTVTAGRKVQGVITAFNRLDSSRDQTTYQVVLESRLALLRNAPKCRFFLNTNFPKIIEQILREHSFDAISARFDFQLYREYEPREFVMQWHESDLEFIIRLCRRSGIWFVQEEGEHCEVVRFGDDLTHYRHAPGLTVPFLAGAGHANTGGESVASLRTHAKTIPERQMVRAYSYRAAPVPIDAESIVRGDDTTYGQTYTWGASHVTQPEADREAQLRHEAALAEQIEYHGASNVIDATPSSVLKLWNKDIPEAEYGMLLVRVESSGSRTDSFRNEFTAVPSDRFYRLPLNERAWPKVHGTVSGRITSPNQYKFAYIDAAGEYVVDLHLDRDARPAGGNSCRLRLAKPFAGASQTGFHFPLVDGTEVLIAFQNGDPDLPYIAHAMHNSRATDLIVNDKRWLSRNAIRTQSNNTLQMEDWDNEEHVKLATERVKSQLNLGHMVDRARKKRGEGAEVRTDGHASVRGGKGLLLSAEAQPKASGQQLDMQGAQDQLNRALDQMRALAEVARTAQAIVAECDKQKALLNDTLMQLKRSGVLVTAPDGIALTSAQHLQLAAGENLIATAGGSADIGAVRKFTVAAGEAISLFAHRLGMKLFAAQGKVEIQAQTGELNLASDKDTTISSVNGRVVISAKQEILFKCGGSYFKMTSTGIEDATHGDRTIKSASFSRQGPDGMPDDLPILPKPAPAECALRARQAGTPLSRF